MYRSSPISVVSANLTTFVPMGAVDPTVSLTPEGIWTSPVLVSNFMYSSQLRGLALLSAGSRRRNARVWRFSVI